MEGKQNARRAVTEEKESSSGSAVELRMRRWGGACRDVLKISPWRGVNELVLEFRVRSTYYLDSKQVAGTKERQPRRTEFYHPRTSPGASHTT